MNNLSIFES